MIPLKNDVINLNERSSSDFSIATGLVVTLLVSLPLLSITLITPFRFDNTVIQGIAADLYKYGRIPFLQSWQHDVPGIIYIHYVSMLLIGTRDVDLRIFDCIVHGAFIIFAYHTLRQWLSNRESAISCILYIMLYVGGGVYMYVQRDDYLVMLILLMVSSGQIADEKEPDWTRILLTGVLGGFALIIRSTALAFVAPFALYFLLQSDLRPSARGLLRCTIFAIGIPIPIAILLVYYSQFSGGLESLYLATIKWNLDLYSKFSEPLTTFVREIVRTGLLIPFAIYGFRDRRIIIDHGTTTTWNRRSRLLYAVLICDALVSVLIQRKYLRYQFMPFFAYLIPLASVGIEGVRSKLNGPMAKHYFVIASCFCCTMLMYVPRSPFAFGLAITESVNPWRATYEAEYPDPKDGALVEESVLNFLESGKNNSGTVEICSYLPNLRLHLNRACVGKYNVMDPIACCIEADSVPNPHYTSYQLQWQREYVETLARSKPTFIVIDRASKYFYLTDVYAHFLNKLPAFSELLQSSYRIDTTMGAMEIYRRVEVTTRSAAGS